MSADAACQHDTALLTARLCRWWFAGEVKTALQLEAVSFIGSASIERITLAIFLIFLNGWWPYHLHAFAAMPRPGNWAPRSISRSNFSQVTGGACRKCWYGNKVFGRSLANIPKWSGSRCMPEPRKRIDWLQVASVFLWLCSVQFAVCSGMISRRHAVGPTWCSVYMENRWQTVCHTGFAVLSHLPTKFALLLEALPAAEMSAQAFRKVGDRRGRAQIAAVLAETQWPGMSAG